VIWLNDDAEVCEGYDVAAIDFMRAHPGIGLGALHYSESGGEFHVNSAWGCIYANFGIFRREVGEKVHYFDEEIAMYGADNSIALRLLMSGYGVADIPAARVIHHSEKDSIRAQNQQGRRMDAKVLQDKYMPYRRYWTQNFRKNYIFSGHVPWSHGVEPQKVTA
jgi:GT2 family glycosyltransferase